ncbi:MAG TPA: tRNA pseudouridine(38-40) synthase TruA [Vicinamibacterales bacterium]|jgi:tRNA pseudouridine38-40 synthase|nr:tRNA pseudouridine(38-40) synthase TruA [Vicinamibacterales bacterium]
MRLKLTIEYAGTRYSGWQIQKNARTVQGEIERAILEASSVDDFELYGSGRTDAGVHALAQVAHLDIQSTLPADTLRRRINDALPTDIVILRADRVPHRFHARRDALARSYLYQVSRRRTAFAKPFVWWVKEDVSVEAMRAAARSFVGFHDFRAFSDDDPAEKSTEVLVDAFDIHEDEDLVVFHIEGSHFIWKMVRRIVGALVEVGRGRVAPEKVAALFDARSSDIAKLTAPASGLFLERVYYPGDRRDQPVRSLITLRRG